MKEVVIDLRAANTINNTNNTPAAQSTGLGIGKAAETRSAEQDQFRGFGEPNNASSMGLGGTRPYYGPDTSALPYEDTFIGLHHNPRGVRFAFQANNRKALMILVVLIALLSRPGFIDVLLTVLKPLLGMH